MTVNLAVKYSDKIDERFALTSVTAAAVNNNYDFSGSKTVKVYSIPTVAMNDYERTGTARYGTPAELGDEVQELTMKKDADYSASFLIDSSFSIINFATYGGGVRVPISQHSIVLFGISNSSAIFACVNPAAMRASFNLLFILSSLLSVFLRYKL